MFGDFNSKVEFFLQPSSQDILEVKCGFRVFKDTLKNSYILEFKYFKKDAIDTGLGKKTVKNDEIVGQVFEIKTPFVELLFEKMVDLIHNFKAKAMTSIIDGGDRVTFRTVVEDEVWTLNVHVPRGNAQKMSDLCKTIMKDATNDNLNEENYMKILEKFNFKPSGR